MSRTRTALAAAATAGIGAAATWELARRRDLTAIEADPERPLLVAPEGGREQEIETSDGTVLHAEVFGPDGAPTIVLVHGWTCAIRFWTRQIAALRDDVRVVAYDQRGHGRSGPAGPAGYRIEAFAGDLTAVLDQCVPEGERAVLAGHSLGAMTLVAWAGLNAGDVERRVAAAALVNTGMGDLIQQSLVAPVPGALGRLRQLVGSTALSAPLPLPKGPTPISHRVVQYVALSPGATPAQVAFSEELVIDCRPDVRGAVGRTLSRLDQHAAARRLTVPTLVLAGDRDRLTPLTHAERLADDLPDARLQVLPGSGHMGPLEHADTVSAALRELVSAHASRSAAAAR